MKRYLVRYKLTKDSPEKILKIYAESPDIAESISFDILGVLCVYYTDAILMKSFSKYTKA